MSEMLPSTGLNDVLITAALAQRPSRTPNLQAETEALHTVARQLAEQSQTMLKTLVTVAKDLCQVGSAGVSLLEVTPDGEEMFCWSAIAGALAEHEGGTISRSFSPCGTCLDLQKPQLYSHPERYFTYLEEAKTTIVEGLTIPLMGATNPLGTIWVVSHDESRQFDLEDVRLMTSLADFTAAALQSIHLRQAAEVALQREQAARQDAEANRRAFDESARRAVEILESITDAFVCVDQDWRITYANQEAARVNGLQPEEMVGKTYQDMEPCAIATVLKQIQCRITAEPEITQFEVFDESSKKWLEIHAYPCKVGFSVYFRDITERKQDKARRQEAESALRESESRFRLIVESARDYAIFTLNASGIITSWNPGAERLLGYHEAEIIGQPNYIIFTPEDRETRQSEKELQTALAQGHAEDERWHLRKDGSRFFASGLMMQLRDEAGNLQGLVKMLRDRTEAHQAAEREQFLSRASAVLAETLDYKITLFNIAQLAVPFLADFCFFDILSPSNQIERAAWYHGDPTKQEWFEQLQQYTPPHKCESHPITKVLSTGKANLMSHVTDSWMQIVAINAEHLQFMRDCQTRSLITVPLTAHGRRLGALTLGLTASSNRRYTPTDLAVAEELGHRAALAFDNAQLYQQAQESNRMKDEFMAVLSHELRSPLNPILGWIQMLRKGVLDANRTAKAWAAIERNARLQAQLVEDLLDISRILRGKLSLNVAPVNLVATVQAAMETVQLAAQAKSIEIETRLDSHVGLVLGDATRLQQVVWNVLSNAVKFTPEGGQIEVSLEHQDNQALITVRDRGIGIHASFLPHVFDYFRQADGATTRRFGGLGLGLAIVRQLVEAHGGSVQVESPGEGQGATFTIRLPLITAQAVQEENRQPSEEDFNLQDTQILVVDNEPDALEFATFVLEQAGAKVISATSADEALTLLSESQPDLLVSDIGMPDMDGYMLMKQVRSLPPEQGGKVPAIALTAYAGDINYRQAIAAGFQRHISKPIEPETFVKTVAALVQPTRHGEI
ncbi:MULTISPECIES: PAS domain S-box protein [unclassified Leptolyngbya]|uniref:PAS domain S-box protein n=1 Tax=unclassified Leptolyngbya TaxID=2650499 RepID=UPI001686CBD0|nr:MULTISPECIES: PAS domain S-box protein [unclassified Leptolyngbya]MBD1909219.1 PAS domain S-box protein [Leptolyngbya sp. FACHB-8]MBD2153559.1 PAS domain S-box protein [Leptolyngbya sp. FACHB-16]